MSQADNEPAPLSPELDALLAIGSSDSEAESTYSLGSSIGEADPGGSRVYDEPPDLGDEGVDRSAAGNSSGIDLSGADSGEAEPDDILVKLSIDHITPNPYQPRREFDADSLIRLADSIEALGVLQPIVVRRQAYGQYELIAGERRWRAARIAGLDVVPAVVRSVSDRRSLEEAIVENLHRSDLNVFEEAAAYQRLMDDFGLTQEDVAHRVGKSRSAVANIMRLMQLPAEVQAMVISGDLGAGHARALLGLQTQTERKQYAAYSVRNKLTARQIEELVKRGIGSDSPRSKGKSGDSDKSKSAAALEIERMLSDWLATRVQVRESSGNGQIVVEFADLDDLGRIYELLNGVDTDQLD